MVHKFKDLTSVNDSSILLCSKRKAHNQQNTQGTVQIKKGGRKTGARYLTLILSCSHSNHAKAFLDSRKKTYCFFAE